MNILFWIEFVDWLLNLSLSTLELTGKKSILKGFDRKNDVLELVQVIYDKATGRSRGFGFVTMSTVEEVEAAAQQFNGYVSFLVLASVSELCVVCCLLLSTSC